MSNTKNGATPNSLEPTKKVNAARMSKWPLYAVLLAGLFLLGVLVYVRWPSDSVWVLGTLLGINLIFSGASLLALGIGSRKATAA